MPKKMLTKEQIQKIVYLRQTGHSLPEIKFITKHANASVFKYIAGVDVLSKYKDILKEKQGGSKKRSKVAWNKAKVFAENAIGNLSERDKLIFLAGLYWGEGTKKDFNLINGDPYLIRSFINGLYSLGVKKDDIKLNFRIFSNMNKNAVIKFWIKFLNFERSQVGWFEVIKDGNKNKLINGMCRVRVKKGGWHFKQVMSMIDYIKLNNKPL